MGPLATGGVSLNPRKWTSTHGRFMLSFLSISVGLVIWQLFSTVVYSSILFPSATATLGALAEQLTSGELGRHIGITSYRVLVGFLVGSALGAMLGLLMGSFALVRKLLDPYTNFFRFITPIAWITPAVIWFGVGEGSKLFLIIYSTLFIVLINTMAGVAHIHRDRQRMASAFGANAWQMFCHVTLPATVGFILTGMRVALGNSFMTVIGAEILSANTGMGYLIYSARVYFRADTMFAVIILLGGMGFMADRLFAVMQTRIFWRYREGR